MADVSAADRAAVRRRDGDRCVTCGGTSALTMQHRAAVGSGGTSLRVGVAGLLTACAVCNARFEGDLQAAALTYGWKVRTWVVAAAVPVFYLPVGEWFALLPSGGIARVSRADAHTRMRAVYGAQWSRWVADSGAVLGLEGVAS